MKNLLALIFLCPSLAVGTVVISVQMGEFSSADGSDAPLSSYAVLVSDTGSDGFLGQYTGAGDADFGAFDGTTLSIGSNLGGTSNDEIIGVFQMVNLGGFSGIQGDLTNIDLTTGNLSAGQNLAVFWFPTISTASITGSLAEYGYYRSDVIDTNAGGDMAFVMPSDGANLNLYTFTINLDSSDPQLADLTAVAVPEPSTYALAFGVLMLVFVLSRRARDTRV